MLSTFTWLLIIAGVLIAAPAVIRGVRLRVSASRDAPQIGWMSEQWLAEHRAEHPR